MDFHFGVLVVGVSTRWSSLTLGPVRCAALAVVSCPPTFGVGMCYAVFEVACLECVCECVSACVSVCLCAFRVSKVSDYAEE